MEPSVIPGDEMPDIYSINPFNITFPDEVMGFVPDGRNYTEPNPVKSPAGIIVAISITALYSVICVVGLLGNILVMYGVVRYTKLKTATNIYIFNMALADALATSTLPFQSAKYLMNTWPFGEFLCKMVIAIDYYNMFTSIFTLTMMSVDRYIAVCHPVRALEFRTPIKAKIINVCIWMLSSAVGVPIMIMAVTKVTNQVLVITICYGLMILRLRSVRLLSGTKEKDRNMRRITRMVLVVVAAFIICWTPIHIFIIVKTLVDINQKNPFVIASWHLCIALGYTNSSLNPVLYAFLDENFKRCFRDFCPPFRTRAGQNTLNRARNATREPVSVCAPSEAEKKPV
ncbi:delta-type opioid receptor-like isoform X2 [Myxocyprinus asiaticus]|uniref:delta-type opioid receptor-like isoform X2 n=1 Tax=Myxocyprinus asiaticus TaxID=70543 RepID=UPI002222BC0A|nr:delta-type opioid receptor-like isoform X2 [Myxocyprinus asiaticus]